jgi:hypothetical protein
MLARLPMLVLATAQIAEVMKLTQPLAKFASSGSGLALRPDAVIRDTGAFRAMLPLTERRGAWPHLLRDS